MSLHFTSTTHQLYLHYAVYGDTSGYPVIYCHGYPGSHKECPFPEDLLQAQQLCFIVVERPGYGHSSGTIEPLLNNWIDIIQQIIETQNFDNYAVMGFSGGGLYAQAIAASAKLNAKINKLVLAASASPLMGQGEFAGILPSYKDLYELARFDAAALQTTLAALLNDADAFWELFLSNLPDADKQSIKNNNMTEILKKNFYHAALNGSKGLYQDVLMHVKPWTFNPSAITCPSLLLHSTEDVNIPVAMCEDLANTINLSETKISDDKGHYCYLDNATEIFNFIKH